MTNLFIDVRPQIGPAVNRVIRAQFQIFGIWRQAMIAATQNVQGKNIGADIFLCSIFEAIKMLYHLQTND